MGKLGVSPPHHLRIEIFSQHLINKIKTHISSTLISDQKIISKGKIEKTKERYAEVGNGEEVPKMTFLYILMNKIGLNYPPNQVDISNEKQAFYCNAIGHYFRKSVSVIL